MSAATHVLDAATSLTLNGLEIFTGVSASVIYPEEHPFASLVGAQRVRHEVIRLKAVNNLFVKHTYGWPSIHFLLIEGPVFMEILPVDYEATYGSIMSMSIVEYHKYEFTLHMVTSKGLKLEVLIGGGETYRYDLPSLDWNEHESAGIQSIKEID